MGLPLSQNGKRKGEKNHKNSFHTLLTMESSFSNLSGQKERFSLRVLGISMFAAPYRSISSLPVLYSGQGRETKREKGEGRGGKLPYTLLTDPQRSPFLVLWPKNIFSWVFPGSYLPYSLKIWPILKSKRGRNKETNSLPYESFFEFSLFLNYVLLFKIFSVLK